MARKAGERQACKGLRLRHLAEKNDCFAAIIISFSDQAQLATRKIKM